MADFDSAEERNWALAGYGLFLIAPLHHRPHHACRRDPGASAPGPGAGQLCGKPLPQSDSGVLGLVGGGAGGGAAVAFAGLAGVAVPLLQSWPDHLFALYHSTLMLGLVVPGRGDHLLLVLLAADTRASSGFWTTSPIENGMALQLSISPCRRPMAWRSGCRRRIERVLARNPSPFTFRGTGVYLVGDARHVAVIDPGPNEPGPCRRAAGGDRRPQGDAYSRHPYPSRSFAGCRAAENGDGRQDIWVWSACEFFPLRPSHRKRCYGHLPRQR